MRKDSAVNNNNNNNLNNIPKLPLLNYDFLGEEI